MFCDLFIYLFVTSVGVFFKWIISNGAFGVRGMSEDKEVFYE